MNIKKLLPYIGAILLGIAAIVGIVKAMSNHTDTPDSWGQLATSVKQVQVAADLATTASVASKDFEVCVATTATSALAGGVADSLVGVQAGTCRIPDVSVDVSKCLALKATPVAPEAPVVPAVEAAPAVPVAPVVEAAPAAAPVEPVAVVSPVEVAPAAPAALDAVKDIGPIVDVAVGPLVALLQGALAQSDASPQVKAWATGTIAWLQSGQPSIVALIQNPGEGKLSFKGVDIEGCKP